MSCMPRLWEKLQQELHWKIPVGQTPPAGLWPAPGRQPWHVRYGELQLMKFSLPAWSAVCTTHQHLTQSSQLLLAAQHVTWLQVPSRHVWSPCHHLSSSSYCWPVCWVCSSSLFTFSWFPPVVLTPQQSDFSPTPDQSLFPSNLVPFCLTEAKLLFCLILRFSDSWKRPTFTKKLVLTPLISPGTNTRPCKSMPIFCVLSPKHPAAHSYASCCSKTNCIRFVSKLILKTGTV